MFLLCDPSLAHYGWAVVDKFNNIVAVGCIDTKPIGKIVTLSDNLRLKHIINTLKSVVTTNKIATIIIEEFAGAKSAKAVKSLSAVKGITMAFAIIYGFKEIRLSAQTVKKSVTGIENADKSLVKSAVKNYWLGQFDLKTKNMSILQIEGISDALALYICAKNKGMV